MIDVNLKQIGQYLTEQNIWGKAFVNMEKWETRRLCEVILEATSTDDGATPPYIDEQDRLVIPFNAPQKYRWWQGGQTLEQTLEEIGATDEIKRRYVHG
jgi:hypothetical protein